MISQGQKTYIESMENTYSYRQVLRKAHAQYAKSLGLELFLTLSTNQNWTPEQMKQATRRFLARLDRAMLGRNWSKKSKDERMNGLMYMEHLSSNTHVHGLMTRPYCNLFGLQMHGARIWNEICPGGSVLFKEIGDVEKRSEYVTKEAFEPAFFEVQFFQADEFMRAPDK